MTVKTDSPSGTPDDSSGNDQSKGKDDENKQPDKVAYETYQKTLNQEKNLRDKNKEQSSAIDTLNTELEKLKADKVTEEEAELLKAGDKDKIIESRDQKIKDLEEKIGKQGDDLTTISGALANKWKMEAVEQFLPGKLMSSEFEGFLKLDDVVVDPETKQIDQETAQQVANTFMEKYAYLVDTKNAKNLRGDAASGNTPYSLEKWANEPLKEMKENMPGMVRKRKKEMGITT